MMFIEAKIQLNKLKFDGKHKKVDLDELGKLFDTKCLNELNVPNPPKNDSDITLKEVKDIIKIRSNLSEFKKKAYQVTDKDPVYFIKDYMDEHGLDYSEEVNKRIVDEVIDFVTSKEPESKDVEIGYPGSGTLKRREKHLKEGIPINEDVWKSLIQL